MAWFVTAVHSFKLPTRRRVHPRSATGTLDYSVDYVTVDLSKYVLG